MLILTRRPHESIRIGPRVRITVLGFKGSQVRLGIEAPPERQNDLRFSILEIADLNASDIDQREAHWKRILLSRTHGYNRN